MKVKYFPIITENVKEMSDFYVSVLQAETAMADLENYVEVLIEDGFTIAIESAASIKGRSGVSIQPSPSVIEFSADNVDEEYARLEKMGVNIVTPPIDHFWGTRTFYFKDPDGNLLSFYTAL